MKSLCEEDNSMLAEMTMWKRRIRVKGTGEVEEYLKYADFVLFDKSNGPTKTIYKFVDSEKLYFCAYNNNNYIIGGSR